ncbi:GDYXXLXY domain-containing protein [Fulvivirgaceae bacterium PWU5]|uniref:GDYXXLXY domain-containing protein n=1 Tax=Dawidia cretensis TaxID=2782350 RepID=A0AAP2GVP5_9BACT|nr:GDYXXLXY domain-containing protein [Dawidia cretensis]MBT1710865.1 GDYXXLXY domain-containing protein [Dawidia cretensis]
MQKTLIIVAFVVMCLAQWFIPFKTILDQEAILSEGRLFKLQTAPIDPSDPFRGKYITLNFSENQVTVNDYQEWVGHEYMYITLADSAGYGRISRASLYEQEGDDYIKVRISYVDSGTPATVMFEYPFERFYLEESKASEAERLYWESRSDSTQQVYAMIRVRNGQAALENVMVNDRPIADIVREMNNKPE